MIKKITIKYSEDFRENKKASKIYSLLKENNFHPRSVNISHVFGLGQTETSFNFIGIKLPENKRLERILQELNLDEYRIEDI